MYLNIQAFSGDSGYPLKSYFLTPVHSPRTRTEQLYTETHTRTRNVVERIIGLWKKRYPASCYGMRCKIQTLLTVAAAVLHNSGRKMHDDLPKPIGINIKELNYLIDQGNIAELNNHNVDFNFRDEVNNIYFLEIYMFLCVLFLAFFISEMKQYHIVITLYHLKIVMLCYSQYILNYCFY